MWVCLILIYYESSVYEKRMRGPGGFFKIAEGKQYQVQTIFNLLHVQQYVSSHITHNMKKIPLLFAATI